MTIFRTDARSTNWRRYVLYGLLVGAVAAIDTGVTVACVAAGAGEMLAKACATGVAMVANFTGRKYVVFAKAPRARAG